MRHSPALARIRFNMADRISPFEFKALYYINDLRSESLGRLTNCTREFLDSSYYDEDEHQRKQWWSNSRHRDLVNRMTGYVAEQLIRKGLVKFAYGLDDTNEGDEHARQVGLTAIESLQEGQEPETMGFLGAQLHVTPAGLEAMRSHQADSRS